MLKNFVLETANAPGTSTTFNLGGAASGRLSFSGAGFTNGQVVFYVLDDGSQKEWGIGTFNTGSPNTMSRTTVIGNSAGTTARLNFTGTTNVYNALPAEKTLWIDDAGKVAIPGRTDGANALAGNIGEVLSGTTPAVSSTVTITIANPGIVSWASHPFKAGSAVRFGTTGALPTGIVSPTTYYVAAGATLQAGSFALATTVANAMAGTTITTSGSQSGTHTGAGGAILATGGTAADIAAISLPAGDWDVWATAQITLSGTTNPGANGWLSTTSATLPSDLINNGVFVSFVSPPASGGVILPVGQRQINVSGPTTVFLSQNAIYTGGTVTGTGALFARRRS